MLSEERDGTVVRVDAHAIIVDVDGELVRCVRRGKLFEKGSGKKTPVVVGDEVVVRRTGEGEGAVEAVKPRRSSLSRPAAHRAEVEHVLCANIDQVMLVVAARSPEPKPGLIDRLWVVTRRSELPLVVCVNKLDLVSESEVTERFSPYASLDLTLLFTSAVSGAGQDGIRERLRGKTTVLCGPSGVGKTSLLNRICPGFQQRVASVSSATGKGRHTTTAALLVTVPDLGRVVDTPGIREFGLWDVSPEELGNHFFEILELSTACKFRDCRHSREPGCAVKAAVAEGRIAAQRYESYLRIFASLESGGG